MERRDAAQSDVSASSDGGSPRHGAVVIDVSSGGGGGGGGAPSPHITGSGLSAAAADEHADTRAPGARRGLPTAWRAHPSLPTPTVGSSSPGIIAHSTSSSSFLLPPAALPSPDVASPSLDTSPTSEALLDTAAAAAAAAPSQPPVAAAAPAPRTGLPPRVPTATAAAALPAGTRSWLTLGRGGSATATTAAAAAAVAAGAPAGGAPTSGAPVSWHAATLGRLTGRSLAAEAAGVSSSGGAASPPTVRTSTLGRLTGRALAGMAAAVGSGGGGGEGGGQQPGAAPSGLHGLMTTSLNAARGAALAVAARAVAAASAVQFNDELAMGPHAALEAGDSDDDDMAEVDDEEEEGEDGNGSGSGSGSDDEAGSSDGSWGRRRPASAGSTRQLPSIGSRGPGGLASIGRASGSSFAGAARTVPRTGAMTPVSVSSARTGSAPPSPSAWGTTSVGRGGGATAPGAATPAAPAVTPIAPRATRARPATKPSRAAGVLHAAPGKAAPPTGDASLLAASDDGDSHAVDMRPLDGGGEGEETAAGSGDDAAAAGGETQRGRGGGSTLAALGTTLLTRRGKRGKRVRANKKVVDPKWHAARVYGGLAVLVVVVVVLTVVLVLQVQLGSSTGHTCSSFECGASGHAEVGFEYDDGPFGPAHWGQIAASCDGVQQSPIDLQNSTALRLRGTRNLPHNSTAMVYSITTRVGHPGFFLTPTDAAEGGVMMIGATPYYLKSFHFHSPSEHTIAGRHAALEAHFVHMSATGAFAVYGILFDAAADDLDNDDLIPLYSYLRGGHATGGTMVALNVWTLMNDVRPYMFLYNGSLTTPPCTEGVQWFVVRANTGVSARQLAAFHTTLGMYNARPAQALGARAVDQYSTTPWEDFRHYRLPHLPLDAAELAMLATGTDDPFTDPPVAFPDEPEL